MAKSADFLVATDTSRAGLPFLHSAAHSLGRVYAPLSQWSGAEAQYMGSPGESPGPFLVLPMTIDGISAILTGVGDHVAEPEGKHDDGANPKNVDGETDEASQECDRKDCHHHNV